MSETKQARDPADWRQAWPDFLAFAIGIAQAWIFHWKTTDLVWSLWLSSLLVGYAMIFWSIFGPVLRRMSVTGAGAGSMGGRYIVTGLSVVGGLFELVFFTIHFGGFHFVHSVFLNHFFPVLMARGFPEKATYVEVFRRYWYFVPLAALAERGAFRWRDLPDLKPGDVSAKGVMLRKSQGDGMMAPYMNVIRMHFLIFFFAFAHFAGIENFWIYSVVYAAYFFPWRCLRYKPAPT